ncbi:hypothetical protein [Streptomyces sp. NPDC051211]|uniref:hypothetical protein n=1 Tax=Streptomyces sp. NPDC051211 TaxID=3154643 RepID=UPI00344DFEA1
MSASLTVPDPVTRLGVVDMTRAVGEAARNSRRWWLTRRLHIDLLRVCSAFGRSR